MGHLNDKIITEELKQIVVLMNYDRSKTLIEQMGHKPWMGPNPAFYRNNSDGFVSDTQKWHDDNVAMMDNLIGDLDAHDILMAIEIGAMVIAPFTGPLAPVFLAVSYGAGLADAAVYYFVDDDPHSAWIALALTVVPGLKFGKVFKKSGWFIKKFGRKTTSELLDKWNKFKKGDKSLKFTEEELKFLKEAGEDIASEVTQKVIKEELKVVTKKGLVKIYSKKTLKTLFNLVYKILKASGKLSKEIGKIGIQLGVTYISFDQLYLYFYGNDEDRQKSEFKQVADIVQEFGGDLRKKLIELITGVTDEFSDEELVDWTETINSTGKSVSSPEELEAAKKRVFNTKQENLPGKKITIDDIRKGKSVLHYGDQGPSVKQIQKMLLKIGLDLGEKGADSFYGDDTKDAVEYFQMNLDSYGIEDAIMLDEIDGIVGDETLKAIEKAIKNKDNG
jgi:hypothetical protein